MPKVLVVGFDGATWDIINPLVDQNNMPTFRKLMNESTWGHLESTIPPITIPAWISMFSGLAPEKLRMFDFVRLKVNGNVESTLFNSHDFKGKVIWDFLSQENTESLVLNMPGTYPPYPVRGHIIGFDLTPMENCTYPGEIEKLLIRDYNFCEIKELQKTIHRGEKTALRVTEEEEKKILEILTSFSRTYSYDTIFVRFGIPDHVSHHSIRDEAMVRCHVLMDFILKTVIDSIEFDYLILVSDHGIRKEDKVFYINRYLEDVNLLKTSTENRILRFFVSSFSEIFGEEQTKSLYKKMMGFLKKRLDVEKRSSFVLEKLDMGKTVVFGYLGAPTNFCPLYITDMDFKDRIIEELETSKYIRNIHLLACENPFAIVESQYPISPLIVSKKEVALESHWVHDMKGIFLVYGKDVKKGYNLDCNICDVAPTLLFMLGLPVPDTMDGNIVTEIFEEDSEIGKRTPEYVDIEYYIKRNEEEKLKRSIRRFKMLEKT